MVNQYKVFSAVMSNFDTAVKVTTEDVKNFNNSALRENERYMESVQARIQAVKTELQQLVLDSSLTNLVKVFLKLTELGLRAINALGGLPPVLTLISGILLTFNIDKLIVGFTKLSSIFKNYGKFGKIFQDLGKDIKTVTTYLIQQKLKTDEAAIATDGATVSITTYEAALSSLRAVMSAVVAVVTIFVSIMSVVISKQKEAEQEQLQLLKTFADYVKTTNEAIEALNDEKISRENLNSIIDANFDAYDAEILKLMDVNTAREKAIELLEKEKEKRAGDIVNTGRTSYEESLARVNEKRTTGITGFWNKIKINASLSSGTTTGMGNEASINEAKILGQENIGLKEYIKNIQELKEAKEAERLAAVKEFGQKSQQYKTLTIQIKDYEKAIKISQEQLDNDTQVIEQFNNALLAQGKAYDYATGEIITLDKAKEQAFYGENSNTSFITSIEDDLKSLQEVFDLTDKQIKQVKDRYYEEAPENEEATVFSVAAEMFPEIVEGAEEAEESLENLSETVGATAEEIERAENFLSQMGLKEKELEKEIGMTSVELLRQADAWNMDGEALYNYLTALNNFDNSMDEIQSSYQTLQTAIDEYNETNGFSIDTTQALLRMSPEYLEMLDEAISGHKSLKDSITEKVKAQALEAKQTIYNIAIDRINKLGTEEAKEANNNLANSFVSSTEDIDGQTEALERNSETKIKNAVAGAAQRKVSDKEINQILDDMYRQLDAVDKMVLSVGTDFSTAMGNSTNSTKSTNSALKEQNELLKQQKQELEEKKKQYDTVVSYIKKKIQGEIDKLKDEKKAQVDAIKDQIDALKDLKDAESDAIDEQIDKLKEQKEIEEEYWSEKIEAFKKQNEELEEQLEYEELLENLAKAKSKRVRVYKEGQGFVYTDDSNEVDKAQAKIDEYTRKKEYNDQLELLESYKESAKKNYEQQIDDLEKLKKEKEKNYDEQIKALEQQQKAVEDSYDAQIAYYQAYLDKFTEETDAYENQQNRLLALQLTGIDFEAQGWQTRLDNLANFVEKYNALLGDIHTLEVNGDTGAVTVAETTTTDPPKTTNVTPQSTLDKLKSNSEQYKINNLNLGQQVANKNYKDTTQYKAYTDTASKNKKTTSSAGMPSYVPRASGDAFINKDGAYLVGENPNQELIIGSKLNGSLVNLSRGSGVVNSTSTNTLAGILNQLGAMSQNGINMSNSQTRNTNISIGNISLPNVSNGKDFVDYLQDFSLQMTQTAFA